MKPVVRGVGWLLAALLALALVAYLVAPLRKNRLDEAERTRAQADGSAHAFVTLPDGVTHYRLEGPDDARVVVLVHGFSNGSYVWDAHVPALAAAGYRAVALDLYGRGFSDRPNATYDAELYVRQIAGLLDSLGFREPVDLAGYSMGGAIVAELAARHPERVRSVVFVAPAGLSGEAPRALTVLATPVLGDWIFRVLGPSILDRMNVAELREANPSDAIVAAYRRQAGYQGYEAAMLSTIRHLPLFADSQAFEAVGRSGKPVAVFWGTQDRVVPFARSQELLRLVPQAKLYALEGMTHAVTYAHPEAIQADLIAFLNGSGT
jgi:pimeloyl-ACP methyl ester carboxylesterase